MGWGGGGGAVLASQGWAAGYDYNKKFQDPTPFFGSCVHVGLIGKPCGAQVPGQLGNRRAVIG